MSDRDRWFLSAVILAALILALQVGSCSASRPKDAVANPIPPVTTEERMLGELTLMRKMMEEDRRAREVFERDMKVGRIPSLPGLLPRQKETVTR